MKIIAIVILFYAFITINAQNFSSKILSDFIVSKDNNPSTFLQYDTHLYVNNHDLIYTWYDYRLGNRSCFAQRIDVNGRKIGNNFKLNSNLDLCISPDKSFLLLDEEHFPIVGGDNYKVIGKIYNSSNLLTTTFDITSGYKPWCGTGWLGLHHLLIRNDSSYIYFHSSGGVVSLHKISFGGTLLYHSSPSDSLPRNNHEMACASNKKNDYALFSLQFPGLDAQGGLYATFFSSNDQILLRNKLIKSFSSFYAMDFDYKIAANTIKDSIYQVFIASSDSQKLFIWKMNKNGSQIQSQTPLSLFSSGLSGDVSRYVYNLSVSPVNNGLFSALVTLVEYRSNSSHYYNTLFNFNNQGDLLGVFKDSTIAINSGRNIFTISDGNILVPADSHNDAYQKRLNHFFVLDSLKLNDDLLGSNEVAPALHKINDQVTLVSYVDENNTIARKINEVGTLLTEEIVLAHRNIKFFPDGGSVAVWSEQDPITKFSRVGFSLFDPNFYLQQKIVLNNFNELNNHVDSKVISNSDFVVSYYSGDNLFLRLYSQNGAMLKEKLVSTNMLRNQIVIIPEEQNSFLLTTYNFAQLFNNQLEPISAHYLTNTSHYLGNLMELKIKVDYLSNQLSGSIVHFNGDTLVNNFFLGTGSNNFYFRKINDDLFGFLFNNNNNIYIKCFSITGNQVDDSILIHRPIAAQRNSPYFIVNNDKIYLTWSDLRNIENGYDVYMSILNLSDLTSISDEVKIFDDFELFQNYPNPFNPSTTISWQSPVGSWQTLKVYDVLGKEIATLVNEYKPAGSYEVEFQSTVGNRQLASGVYYYQLRSGEIVQTKKMIFSK